MKQCFMVTEAIRISPKCIELNDWTQYGQVLPLTKRRGTYVLGNESIT